LLLLLLLSLEWIEHNNIQSLKLYQQVVIFMIVFATKLSIPCAFFFVFGEGYYWTKHFKA
jgi:hypothetical protein